MVVDWIGLFTVVHLFPSETSFGSFPREIRWYFLISASRSRLGPTAGDVSHTKRKTGNIHIYICVCMCVFFLRNRSQKRIDRKRLQEQMHVYVFLITMFV